MVQSIVVLSCLALLLAKAAIGGRVKDAESKKLIANQLKNAMDQPIGCDFDTNTGQIKAKKQKKEISPQQEAVKQLKAFEKKFPGLQAVFHSC